MTARKQGAWSAQIRWHAHVVWDQLTPLMLLLLAFLGLWLGLLWHVNRPLGTQVEAGKRQLYAAVEARLAAKAPPNANMVRSSQVSQSDRFLAFLPPLAERDKQLQVMTSLMQKSGLVIGPIEFRQSAVNDLPVERFSLRFTLQGDYSTLRKTLQTLLNQHSNLAVVKLSLDRSESAPDRLGMTLEAEAYYRAGEPRMSL